MKTGTIGRPLTIAVGALICALLLTGCSQSESTGTTAPPAGAEAKVAEGPLAPELEGIVGWINSEPLTLEGLRGKVVLIDFWTYTCINCIRTFPFLRDWHAKYADDGLVIIGVHTPEFEFEKKWENVQNAMQEHGLGWAVAQDNDYGTWNAFDNHFWPAKYLIDKDGVIRYTHFGEGSYGETEAKIRELLQEIGNDLKDKVFIYPADPLPDQTYITRRGFGARITPELYAGYERGCYFGNNYVGHSEHCDSLDQVVEYQAPDFPPRDRIYLQGPWYNGEESLTHARETSDFEDYMVLNYSARSVNVVIRPEGEALFKVLVTLDGLPLDETNKGEDVVIDQDGRSFLHVDAPKLYKVVETPSYGSHVLQLSSNSTDFAIFAFTFGVYASEA